MYAYHKSLSSNGHYILSKFLQKYFLAAIDASKPNEVKEDDRETPALKRLKTQDETEKYFIGFILLKFCAKML